MKGEHFGAYLRQRREAQGLSLSELSRATKIKERTLELLEESRLEALPPRVFVTGYISAYARQVRADERHALACFRAQLGVPAVAPLLKASIRALEEDGSGAETADEPIAPEEGADPLNSRRRLGMALVVFLILVVATLTLSLLLRHGAQPGDGISLLSSLPPAVV